MNRPQSPPPELPGYTFERGIGGGGFADVYLYVQHRPNRRVAVKVLRSEHLGETGLRQFEAEADLMAEVSAHPYIVTIFSSGTGSDGRPYIAMEYYPKPHFGVRARGGALPISEVLRVGVQVCSAVETAHRAGILHRDIKPANILTSSLDRPGLTDFGIAGAQRDGTVDQTMGVSLAFAAPEVLSDDTSGGTKAYDIYALGATVYSLLAGRSPFWLPGRDNSDPALAQRVLAGDRSAIGRPDVPPSLERLLAQAMSVEMWNRPDSALSLARGLQDIEQELRLPTTQIEVSTDDAAALLDLNGAAREPDRDGTDQEDKTHRRSPQVITAQPPIGSPPPVPSSDDPLEPTTRRRPSATSAPAPPHQVIAHPDPDPSESSEATGGYRRLILTAATAAFCLVAIAAALVFGSTSSGRSSTTTTVAEPALVGGADVAAPDPPTHLRAVEHNGAVTVTWNPPASAQQGDRYRLIQVGSGVEPVTVTATSYRFENPSRVPDQWCVEVDTIRTGAQPASGPETCVVLSAI